MERIQSALEKARSRRSGDGSSKTDTKRARPASRPRGSEADAAWAALPVHAPDPKILSRNRIAAYDRTDMSVPIDMLRTKVTQIMRDNGWKRLAVTSPGSACGKTTTCLNLCYSLARQEEHRPILIEMDLRRPSLLPTLGMKERSLQFAKVLEGRAAPEEHLIRIADNLAVGMNQGSAKNPSELLQSSTMRGAIDTLEATYDPTVVVFDMPPMLVSDDVMGFADTIDCVLLVAAAESSTIAEVDSCERELASRTNVLGVVLNKCRYTGKDYGYPYYA